MAKESQPHAPAILTSSTVKITGDTVRIGAPVSHLHHAEPTIQLVREDGVVRAIDITCGCGERIRVVCEYS